MMKLLVVNFHYIRDRNVKKGIKGISFNVFKNQITKLSERYKFISQNQLIEIISKKKQLNHNFCLLTFDDNLKEHYRAFKFLKKKNIPAIFFISSFPYLEKKILDVHKLHIIFSKFSEEEIIEFLEKEFNFSKIKIDSKLFNNNYNYDSKKIKKIKIFLNFIIDLDERKKFINNFFYKSNLNEKELIDEHYMSLNEIKEISKDDYLGTHAHSHKPLGLMSLKDMKTDIELSINFLNKLCSKNIRSISYPHGREGSVNSDTIKILKENRIDIGFTLNRGLNENLVYQNPYYIERVDTNDAPGGLLNSDEYSIE